MKSRDCDDSRHARDDSAYQCHLCPKRFRFKHDRKRHICSFHLRKNLKTCGLCAAKGIRKQFTRENSLKSHIRAVHQRRKDFSCPICKRSFSRKFNMLRHATNHSEWDKKVHGRKEFCAEKEDSDSDSEFTPEETTTSETLHRKRPRSLISTFPMVDKDPDPRLPKRVKLESVTSPTTKQDFTQTFEGSMWDGSLRLRLDEFDAGRTENNSPGAELLQLLIWCSAAPEGVPLCDTPKLMTSPLRPLDLDDGFDLRKLSQTTTDGASITFDREPITEPASFVRSRRQSCFVDYANYRNEFRHAIVA